MAAMAAVAAAVTLLFATFSHSAATSTVYIVYLGGIRNEHNQRSQHHLIASHHRLLGSVGASNDNIVYSYTRSFNGFAAALQPRQASELSKLPGVVSVFPSKENVLHTTRSWEFLGLEDENLDVPAGSLWKKSNYGKGVIIGSLDTGVWPEADSFKDDSFDPVPEKWKGSCVTTPSFNTSNCNKKLIGAKFYIKAYELGNGPLNLSTGEFRSPRDKDGHGTHTSSTAAGRFVPGANILGFANGTAKGGAPLARIAVYKVCWPNPRSTSNTCYDADILAAMDDAIGDGVDIMTLSLGGSIPLPQLYEDGIAIGAFHATQKGITVICSAGNDGPTNGSVGNVAPWILTVAASSVDREFGSSAILGNNATYKGSSLCQYKLNGTSYPLVSAGDIPAASSKSSESILCLDGSLDPEKTKGKIVACLRGVNARVAKGQAVLNAGGAGMILANSPAEGYEIVADAHVLPALQVDVKSGEAIFEYISSSSTPTAYITPATTMLGVRPAPVMASFSSQGPNSLIPDILKPDVTAPGLNILAAFTEASGPTGTSSDKRIVKFNIESGTSMSCPHIAGVAALLKALHPDWSPAAIKSAIMTTANTHDNRGQLILAGNQQVAGPFNYGSGHVDPNAAADPGLVYSITNQDYVLFLCSLNYSTNSIKVITGQDYASCPSQTPSVSNLNYPSIVISRLEGSSSTSVTRTLTSVSNSSSTYEAFVKQPAGVSVTVRPSKLKFSRPGQQLSFSVQFSNGTAGTKYSFGYLIWSDGVHQVRSSIAVNCIAPGLLETGADAGELSSLL